ncbi:PQQ-dependent sugar dehydrogenase [Flavihumibacter fluvii]|uniref:PQQ-dependent sugar dehydrogenase n=1 Tax=Flavihumibacter fluvii TaxID=2838157 RepID=UPI001BDE16A3|nr:PQQ-dependent sugar dehydrogenase [Flavihumibacter fluvii]ULQ51797.1 PQQ-dependent sugar dehydrogenase [Flavihumibacter fluvii]
MLNDCLQKNKLICRFGLLALFSAILLASSCKPKPAAQEPTASDTGKPDPNRFTPVVLTPDDALDEPMTFEVLKSGKVYISERKGGLKLFDPLTKTVTDAGSIAVNTKYTSKDGRVTEAEEGFNGFTVDPKFEENHWVYLYYAHPTEPKFVLGRWVIQNDKLLQGSEKVMLEIPTQRETCCHTGGGMTWDNSGNLYLTVGNNTGNVADKSQTDERPDRTSWDDQRGSSNTNDLRGKILRIHPEADGSYSIPAGNLFPKGTDKTRPEIYVMGDRNPWRPSIDSKTGFLYWGEVGPDANDDSPTTLAGMDELNQARGPGYFGWPYFIGENRAYPFYDYTKETVHPGKDPQKPINTSVNNTGLTELPPAQPAFISYPYRSSEKFPLVGSGGRCAVGGPIYHQADFKEAKRPFPAYYEGKWIAADLTRGWIMAISMNEKGDYQSMEQFLPSYQPIEPIDIKFGPSGDLYVLEYGSNWFRKSSNAKLVRIEYNAGNRTPLIKATASAGGGSVPLSISLSAAGTKDADGDSLNYEWTINGPAGTAPMVFKEPDPKVEFTQPGEYRAVLTVTDPAGAKNSKSIMIVAGNEPPVIDLTVAGNKTFFFPGQPIKYTIKASDKEDGQIDAKQVAVSIDYTSEGFDYAELIQGQRSVDASTRFAVAQAFISKSDCNSCHQLSAKSIGPMFIEIADRYKGKSWAPDSLAKKIRSGGSGVWGEVNMPAHPSITANDAKTIVNYILNIQDKNISTLPLQGQYTAKVPEGDNGKGSIVVRAAYTDKGATASSPLTAEKQLVLRSPNLSPGNADIVEKATPKLQTMFAVSMIVIPNPNGFIGFRQIDLTGIKQMELGAMAMPRMGYVGGTIEVRLDGPTGELLGQTEIVSVDPVFPAPTANSVQNAGGVKAKPAPQKKAQTFNPFARPGIKLQVKPTSGVHDLYFVFKNDKAKSNDQLMSFSNISLSN